jgi:acetyltransferase-like isoleucine patch superfamily enzyme
MKMRLIFALLLVPFPSFFKIWMYRLFFRYKIGKSVKIGLSAIIADKCTIGDRTRIGHFNLFYRNQDLRIGSDVIVGFANRIFGGAVVDIGNKCHIFRFNEINSILDPLVLGEFDPRLELGEGAVITVNHKIDFTDKVTFGPSVVFAGRNSNIWTHNRQKTAPVSIGRNCSVGSNVQFVAGSSVGEYCVVALGSVITKTIEGEWMIVAGMPAAAKKPLDEDSKVLVTYPTRPELEGIENALPPAN